MVSINSFINCIIVKLVPRFLLKVSLHVSSPGGTATGINRSLSGHYNRSSNILFIPGSLQKQLSTDFSNNIDSKSLRENVVTLCLVKCLECSYENILDTCSALLHAVDNSIVIRSALGIITEVTHLITIAIII